MPDRPPLMIAVMGPTASGKSALAERLAERYDAQLIAADAFQVYRGMDIGTGKPIQKSLYKLIDLRNPNESITTGDWIRYAVDELEKLYALHKNAIFVGGTGLYVRALFQGYGDLTPPDPAIREQIRTKELVGGLNALIEWLEVVDFESKSRIDLKNPVRVRRALEKALSPKTESLFTIPGYKRVKMALLPEKELLSIRIHNRICEMMQNGWVHEVESLVGNGVSADSPGMRAIGYKTLLNVSNNRMTEEQAIEAIAIETRQYAKRQRTWIRTEPDVRIIERFGDSEEAFEEACRIIE